MTYTDRQSTTSPPCALKLNWRTLTVSDQAEKRWVRWSVDYRDRMRKALQEAWEHAKETQ